MNVHINSGFPNDFWAPEGYMYANIQSGYLFLYKSYSSDCFVILAFKGVFSLTTKSLETKGRETFGADLGRLDGTAEVKAKTKITG